MASKSIREVADSISFRQLRLFESVGRLSSVRQGSEECNLSQPAVTQAIIKLEKLVSEPLFDRRANGSYLSPLGEILHRRVQSFLEQMDQALVVLGVGSGKSTVSTIANRISRSQVRGLIAILEHESFPNASVALGLTQASLQRAARDLEGNLRKMVYHRTAAGVMVTPSGMELGRRMKLATQEIEWGIREMRAARGSEESQLTIGALPFGGSMLLATVLDRFAADNPAAEIHIVTEGAPEMMKKLRGGDVDMLVGLVQDTTADDLSNLTLASTPYHVVCRRSHPLAEKADVSIDEITDFQWVVGSGGSSRRLAFEKIFAERARPQATIATSSLPIVRHLLKTSDRLALMTNYELVHDSESFVPLNIGEVEYCPAIGVTLRAGWVPTLLHQTFIEQLQAKVRSSVALSQEDV